VDYVVSAYECRNGAVVRQTSVPLKVVRVGLAAELAFLADQHESLYGLIAVLAAAMAGFGIDFLAMLLRPRKVPAVRQPAALPVAEEALAGTTGGKKLRASRERTAR
jgi:hypothetical protein